MTSQPRHQYREQFDRMIRWFDKYTEIKRGKSRASHHDKLDHIYAFFQNAYHLKDWIKNDPTTRASGAVESHLKNTAVLRLVADICNGTKHLSRNRKLKTEGKDEQYEGLAKSYKLQISAVNEPVFSFNLHIKTKSGPRDAYEVACECVEEWRNFLARFET